MYSCAVEGSSREVVEPSARRNASAVACVLAVSPQSREDTSDHHTPREIFPSHSSPQDPSTSAGDSFHPSAVRTRNPFEGATLRMSMNASSAIAFNAHLHRKRNRLSRAMAVPLNRYYLEARTLPLIFRHMGHPKRGRSHDGSSQCSPSPQFPSTFAIEYREVGYLSRPATSSR